MAEVKICGIKAPEHLEIAAREGARFVGLVFHRNSPRFVEPEQARLLSRAAPTGVKMVGLFVDPEDDWLSHVFGVVPLDMIQLHGTESPVRVGEVKSRFHLPVIKAFAVGKPEDLAGVDAYASVADWFLFDAKGEAKGENFSGNFGGAGQSFDWNILKDKTFSKPWMLSGGLHSGNVEEALSLLHPDAVDVSSGVERERGVKDPLKIAEFIQTVKNQ